MIEDVRDTRSPPPAVIKPRDPNKANTRSLKSIVSGVIAARRYNDTSMYHGYPSNVRPPIVATVLSKLIFQLHARPDGEPPMMIIHTTQHCLRMLHDEAMKVSRCHQCLCGVLVVLPLRGGVGLVVVELRLGHGVGLKTLSMCCVLADGVGGAVLGDARSYRYQPDSVLVLPRAVDTDVHLRVRVSIRVCGGHGRTGGAVVVDHLLGLVRRGGAGARA